MSAIELGKYKLFLVGWISGQLLYSASQGVRFYIVEPGYEETWPSVVHALKHIGLGLVPAMAVLWLYYRVRRQDVPRITAGHHIATIGLLLGCLLNVWGVVVVFAGGIMHVGEEVLTRRDIEFNAESLSRELNGTFLLVGLCMCGAVTIGLGSWWGFVYGGPAAVFAFGLVGAITDAIVRTVRPGPDPSQGAD